MPRPPKKRSLVSFNQSKASRQKSDQVLVSQIHPKPSIHTSRSSEDFHQQFNSLLATGDILAPPSPCSQASLSPLSGFEDMLHPPPFDNDEEWIRMVTHMKHTMGYVVRTMDPAESIVNFICRLCCNSYTEPYHTIWRLSCCGAPCGRQCLAIAMFHDNSQQCPFCFNVFPDTTELEERGLAAHRHQRNNFETLVDLHGSHDNFSRTKTEFTVADLGQSLYEGKSYRNWTGTEFAQSYQVDAVSKEIFTAMDLEPNSEQVTCKVSMVWSSVEANDAKDDKGLIEVVETEESEAEKSIEMHNKLLGIGNGSDEPTWSSMAAKRRTIVIMSPIKEEWSPISKD